MNNDTHLIASEGCVLTDGEIFVSEIWLCSANFIKDWYEITLEEAKERWPEYFAEPEEELVIK
jgi:hypothetical protein